ncbi:MAG: DUF1552 domain-containing protein [Pirellulales bacterium]|nr:DUF1552 domain-containing protein [Pirellulales bacterium]
MLHSQPLDRRTVLKGLGTVVALPWLEAMTPSGRAAETTAVAPRRAAFFFVPNGVHMPNWTPAEEGAEFVLPPTLEPLAARQQDLLILSGLSHDKARANGDGPGDHARSAACFLTACQPFKTDGANLRAGVSVDQMIAQHLGARTRFPSLELGCDLGPQSGGCDSGYSCAYSGNISWRTPNQPASKEIDPRLIFERLFGDVNRSEAAESRARRQLFQKSVLDFVLTDANRLRQKLGQADRRKLDEYLTAIREIETRLSATPLTEVNAEQLAEMTPPPGVPSDYSAHARLIGDLLVLAFQGDLTRVATFMFANEGSNRSYAQIEVPEGHHDLSHHGNDEAKQAKIAKINRYHMEQFAYIVERMKAIPEGDSTLLDNSLLLYGSGIGDGNRHNHDDLPIMLVGRCGGALRTGRHVRYPNETPLANLFVSLLGCMDITAEKVGDSNGRLNDLA